MLNGDLQLLVAGELGFLEQTFIKSVDQRCPNIASFRVCTPEPAIPVNTQVSFDGDKACITLAAQISI